MEFINLLGGKFIVLNLLLLIVCLALLGSLIKNKFIRIVFSLIFSLITNLQISSLYFFKTFINYPFIIHCNTRDILAMLEVYKLQAFVFILFLIFFTLLIYFSRQSKIIVLTYINSHLNVSTNFLNSYLIIFICAFSCFVMCLSGNYNNKGMLRETYDLLLTINSTNSNTFKENLANLGINNYVLPNELEVSSSNKNIIIISLESFENAYLNNKLSHLTPFLNSLKSNSSWNYFNMEQNEGSKWTSGSLYTTLTGFPAYFGTQHNSIFQTSYYTSFTGLGHIFKKAGYNMTYLVDNVDISGTQDMLYALQINDIIDKTLLKEKVHDKDLFEKAKSEILKNQFNNKPFALYISTMSTHNPNGVYDKRMLKYVPQQKTKIEFMVSAVDYMLRDFISFLKNNDILSNTIIYIFPDHLKHGNSEIFKGTGKRGLFVLTNASCDDLTYNKRGLLYQIDLPKLILEGSGIKHNAKFLTEYISGDKKTFIKNHIKKITALNSSGFSRKHLHPYLIPEISENYQLYKKDTNRYIAHAGGVIDGYTYTNSLEALNENYKKGFRKFELDILKTIDNKYVAVHKWKDWAKLTNYKNTLPVTHKEFLEHKILGKFTPLDMHRINEWFKEHNDAILVTDKVNEPKEFSKLFIDKERLMMELFSWDAVKEAYEAKIKSPMPSQNVIEELGEETLSSLKKYNIKEVAFSRESIALNLELLIKLKENNIKVYGYHINDNIDKDEIYVVKHEMDIIYGIYADIWSFK